MTRSAVTLGATYQGEGRCRFRVWSPSANKVEVHITSPQERVVALQAGKRGYHEALVEGLEPGSLYFYRLDGQRERPDPASYCQPHGVHGPSQVVDPHFPWTDRCWSGLPLRDYIIYELHVGTFTGEGTFEAIIPHLDELKDLGITAVELMPVAQFPGNRNWGYDGVYPFAVQSSYGSPSDLKRLVEACHEKRLAVVLDVVYNHLGPEGNYLRDFGPYFTERYKTPWGPAINFDGPHSDEVRRFYIENALYWVTEFHFDALRIDAVHAILDHSAHPFLQELAEVVEEQARRLDRRVYLIAESDLNDARLVRSREMGGFGLDAQWNDDFHHSVHTLLTGEHDGYYQDFGKVEHLVKAFREGLVYSGQYSPFRRRRHGNSSRDIPAGRFVVFAQSHDQVGNRALGERLSSLVPFEALKLAAGLCILSPFIPLLFMGEEYGETVPFLYFISHSAPALVDAVRRGRREEFAAFQWQGEPPDPQDEKTFLRCRLDHSLRRSGAHGVLLEFYRELIRLRKELAPLSHLSKDNLEALGYEESRVLFVRRWSQDGQVATVFHLGGVPTTATVPLPAGHWLKQLDSVEERWNGKGSATPARLHSNGEVKLEMGPYAFLLLTREAEA